jgi:hypothetical protein
MKNDNPVLICAEMFDEEEVKIVDSNESSEVKMQ